MEGWLHFLFIYNPQSRKTSPERGGGAYAARRQGFAALSGEGGRILRRLEPEEHALLLPMTEAAGMLAALPHRQARLCIRMTAGESGFAPGICRVTED